MNTRTRRTLGCLGAFALVIVLAVAATRWLAVSLPRLTETEVRDAVAAVIDRESPEAFLVTGRLTVRVTTRVENTRTLLPGVLGLDLGTTRAVVRVPGRVSYGFEVDSLRPEMVRMLDNGVIEVVLPPLAVFSVEPDLGELEVETARGWARLGSEREQVERRALVLVEDAMRNQASHHLRTSYQPKINAARALRRLLAPALQGLGMEAPAFQFRLGEDVVVTPSG